MCNFNNRAVTTAILALLCSGCGLHLHAVSNEGDVPATIQPADLTLDDLGEESPAPMVVDITQAFIENGQLRVQARLEAKTSLQTAKVVLQLSGLKDGEVVEQQIQRLSELTPLSELSSGQAVAAQFALNSGELTEYQLRCSWGADAVALLDRVAPKEGLYDATSSRGRLENAKVRGAELVKSESHEPNDEISTVLRKSDHEDHTPENKTAPIQTSGAFLLNTRVEQTDEQCIGQYCEHRYAVSGSLINGTEQTLSGVVLGLGVYWAANGEQPELPNANAPLAKNEKEIRLSRLQLAPHQSRQIRVTVDRAIPGIPGGSFVPHLRLVTADFASER